MPDLDSIKNSISDGVSSLTSNPHLQQVGEYLKAHPTLSNSLLAGLAAGGVGAVATGLGGQRTGETPGGKRKRMLRNALGAALLGGGGAYALQEGMGRIAAPIPGDAPDAVSQGISNAGNKASDIIGSNPALAAAGLGGLAVANAGTVFGSKDRTNNAIRSLLTPADSVHETSALGDIYKKFLPHLSDPAGKTTNLPQLLKTFKEQFAGVDIDDIAKNGERAIMHGATELPKAQRAMHELINVHAKGGDRLSAAEAIKRILAEGNAEHGEGAMNFIKRHVAGVSQRSGLSNLIDQAKEGVANHALSRMPDNPNNISAITNKLTRDAARKLTSGGLNGPFPHGANSQYALNNSVLKGSKLFGGSRALRTAGGIGGGIATAMALAKLLKSDPNQPPQ